MARKSHSRRRNNAEAEKVKILPEQPPFEQPRLRMKPVEFVSADEVESIHQASLRILEETGIQLTHEGVLKMMKEAGADVNDATQMVKIPREIIENHIGTAPSSFKMYARNPKHNLIMGDDYIMFASVGSPPNSFDMQGGRRPGNQEDYRNFLRLNQYFNICHISAGYPVEPVDIPFSERHLECTMDFITLTDKLFHVYSLGKELCQDAIEMVRIARQIDDKQLQQEPSIFTNVNSNSPLKMDGPMLQGIIEMANKNQVLMFTPFTLAGAMAPVTIGGALAQQNAEALFGLAFTQMVRKGAPFVYGGFTSNVDMKTGAPAFGTPEYMKAAIIGGQLARRYNVPYRSSNVCSANGLDAQAAYESVFSLWGTIMGGVNYMKHGLGWMEGGLQAGFEKYILDVELLQMVASFLKPIGLKESDFGFDAIHEAAPGGHFFGTGHTMERYKDAFYAPILSNWDNFENWQDAGSPTVPEKAHQLYKAALADYKEPDLEKSVLEELQAFVAKRKEEGGAPAL